MLNAISVAIWGDSQQLTAAWIKHIQTALDMPITCAYVGPDVAAEIAPDLSVGQTAASTLAAALTKHATQCGGDYFLLLRAGAVLPHGTFKRLYHIATNVPDAQVISALSNAEYGFYPVAPQTPLANLDPHYIDLLCYLCSAPNYYATHAVNLDCSLWRSDLLTTYKHPQTFEIDQLSRDAALYVCDHCYVHLPGRTIPRKTKAHGPQPLDAIRSKLHTAVTTNHAKPQTFRYPGLTNQLNVLHILHDWGGGIARWASDFALARSDETHLFLLSSVNPGQQWGELLTLRVGAIDGPVVRRWTLNKPIRSCVAQHPQYAEILGDLAARFGISQIIVSSLIGHSLAALTTNIATLVVWHDYFPLWPNLDIRFESDGLSDLPAALASAIENNKHFQDVTVNSWQKIQRAYLDALQQPFIKCVAPSHSVVNNVARLLDDSHSALPIQVIPHGIQPFEGDQRYQPTWLERTPQFRLLILGRLSESKGKSLLQDLIRNAAPEIEWVLLGSGRDGHAFFGESNVHIILDYDRDRLPQLLQHLQPHCALLLSQVSESFSYTLSELQALGVPTIATAVGSFVERITPAETGWLVAPEHLKILNLINDLNSHSDKLIKVHKNLTKSPHSSHIDMARRYDDLLTVDPQLAPSYVPHLPPAVDIQYTSILHEHIETQRCLEKAESTVREQHQELNRRADWARSLDRQLSERTRWTESLQQECHRLGNLVANQQTEIESLHQTQQQLQNIIDTSQQQVATLINALDSSRRQYDEAVAAHKQAQLTIDALRGELDRTQATLSMVINSRSWQLTKPFRFAARSVRAGARSVPVKTRRLYHLWQRTRRSLHTRGLAATLRKVFAYLRPTPAPNTIIPSTRDNPQVCHFSRPDEVLVSIVIPVYNHIEMTQQCLQSIHDAKTNVTFEVIVVDDCSTDKTPQILPQYRGIKRLRNVQNAGFIDTCNHGAEHADGDYVVFLNNDTAVADFWLDALLATFEQPNVGLVGAKLVYPDGRLQEAGGIIFSDGSGWNYGRNEDPDHPAYNFVRDADYCSGACIMLPTKAFHALGAFDQAYRPAYYEDTDLAFKVWSAGQRVVYQPRAVVTHFEGVSSGTDTSSGVKRYQVVNQKTFSNHWQDALTRQPTPQTPILNARQHRQKKHVLIVDACTPTPDQDSGSVRMMHLMQILLDLNYHVIFIADNRAYHPQYTLALQAIGVEAYYDPYIGDISQFLGRIGPSLEFAILSRHYVAQAYIAPLRQQCPHTKLIFDTVDLHYLREQRLADLNNDQSLAKLAAETRNQELAVIDKTDATLVVSAAEVKVLEADAPTAHVHVLSNIHPIHGRSKAFHERQNIVFVGGFQHPPNVDAVVYFCAEVMPLIRAQHDDIKFHIIGSKITPEVEALAGEDIIVHGYVPDISPFMSDCRLAVAPLRYGAGVKGKINMSMSYGQPVVATEIALEGMHTKHRHDVMAAHDSQQFADAIIEAYDNETLWNTLSENSLANVAKHFSVATAKQSIETLIAALQQQ